MILYSGSDWQVKIWDYGSQQLLHSIDTGHSANIFCTKFMPETGDDVVVSGAGDAEVCLSAGIMRTIRTKYAFSDLVILCAVKLTYQNLVAGEVIEISWKSRIGLCKYINYLVLKRLDCNQVLMVLMYYYEPT